MDENDINALCREIAEETMDADLEMEMEMLALGPRAFGPDYDDGANDVDGLFYWDLK